MKSTTIPKAAFRDSTNQKKGLQKKTAVGL